MLLPKSTYTSQVPPVRKATQVNVEILVTKERKDLMVRRVTEVVQDRREIRERKALKVTMAIPVTKEKHLPASMEEKAETERTASQAKKASVETKVHPVIRAKEDPKAIEADQAVKLVAARMDPKESVGQQETKVTEVRKVLGVIAVLTTRVPSDLEGIRERLARKALEVIQEKVVVKAPKVLKAREEKRDLMVE